MFLVRTSGKNNHISYWASLWLPFPSFLTNFHNITASWCSLLLKMFVFLRIVHFIICVHIYSDNLEHCNICCNEWVLTGGSVWASNHLIFRQDISEKHNHWCVIVAFKFSVLKYGRPCYLKLNLSNLFA